MGVDIEDFAYCKTVSLWTSQRRVTNPKERIYSELEVRTLTVPVKSAEISIKDIQNIRQTQGVA